MRFAGKIVGLDGVPSPIGGAPNPVVVSTGTLLIVAYYTLEPNPKTSDPFRELACGMLRFEGALIHRFGYPNEDVLFGHGLDTPELWSFAAWEVVGSTWIQEQEQTNRVHPNHRPEFFLGYRHFVVPFKDNTFECLAEGFTAETRPESLLGELLGPIPASGA